MTDTAITTVMDVVFSVFYIGVMLLYNVQLTFCVLATVPIVIASTLLMSTIQQKLIRVKAEQGAKVQSYMVEVLGGISSVKAQHMESLVEATWRDRYVQYLTSGFTTSTINTIFYSYSQFLNTVSSLLVLWVGAGLVLKGRTVVGWLDCLSDSNGLCYRSTPCVWRDSGKSFKKPHSRWNCWQTLPMHRWKWSYRRRKPICDCLRSRVAYSSPMSALGSSLGNCNS